MITFVWKGQESKEIPMMYCWDKRNELSGGRTGTQVEMGARVRLVYIEYLLYVLLTTGHHRDGTTSTYSCRLQVAT